MEKFHDAYTDTTYTKKLPRNRLPVEGNRKARKYKTVTHPLVPFEKVEEHHKSSKSHDEFEPDDDHDDDHPDEDNEPDEDPREAARDTSNYRTLKTIKLEV